MNLINLTVHRPNMAIKVNLVLRALVWDVRALDIYHLVAVGISPPHPSC